jgi:hypothetical protein
MSSFASASLNITSSILFLVRANRSSMRLSSAAPFALPGNRGEVTRSATHMGMIVILIIVTSSVAHPAAIPPNRFPLAFSAVSNPNVDALFTLLDLKMQFPTLIFVIDCTRREAERASRTRLGNLK